MRKTLFFLLAVSFLSTPSLLAEIAIDQFHVREPPPGVKVTAGYLKLKNTSKLPATLTRVGFGNGDVEIHKTTNDNGMMSMVELSELVVPANGELHLKPGAIHLMIMDIKKPLKAGETLTMTFYFKDKKPVKVNATVKAM